MAEDLRRDEDVERVIKQWTPPATSADFDDRMLAAYRQRLPLWTRLMRTRIEVPLPAFAAAALVVLAVSVWLAMSRQEPEEIRWRPVSEPQLRVINAGDTR